EDIAKLLDSALSIPGWRGKVGIDPLLGLLPVVGDVLVTVSGATILLMARQLHVPWDMQLQMAYNLFKNGVIGAVPFMGDLYSFFFKSHQLNAALLVRAVKRGEDGQCPLTTTALSIRDITALALLIAPTVLLVLAVGLWFWERDLSLLSLLYPPPYQSRMQ
ncbi:MAG TPA: DUF4112 domain-containing protein, partial [Nitrospira sp.]|nr:DUF4112 domain-containing protein [Nitrospira sp.]